VENSPLNQPDQPKTTPNQAADQQNPSQPTFSLIPMPENLEKMSKEQILEWVTPTFQQIQALNQALETANQAASQTPSQPTTPVPTASQPQSPPTASQPPLTDGLQQPAPSQTPAPQM
jgi:hypothetical protein